MSKIWKAAIVLMFCAFSASAHYHAIAPEDYGKWQIRKGEQVPYQLIWGHGFEHIWFNIVKPQSFEAIDPEGKKTDLIPLLKEIKVKAVSGEEFLAYSFELKPEARGDYILSLVAGPQWDEEDGVWLQDYAKAVMHVQAEMDWDRAAGTPLEVMPLSRPYGFLPGGALSFRVLKNGKPLAGVRVERELYMAKTPAESDLPSEPFIAYSARSNAAGEVTFSFPTAGWYGITAMAEPGGKMAKDGHEGPVVERATMWVYVSPKPE